MAGSGEGPLPSSDEGTSPRDTPASRRDIIHISLYFELALLLLLLGLVGISHRLALPDGQFERVISPLIPPMPTATLTHAPIPTLTPTQTLVATPTPRASTMLTPTPSPTLTITSTLAPTMVSTITPTATLTPSPSVTSTGGGPATP